MSSWSKRQRFNAVVAGEPADRPPVSAWRHFIDSEHGAEALAGAMVRFQKQYDWDFIKFNPRATYYAETWGNEYNPAVYDGVIPSLVRPVVKNAADLERITVLPGDHGPLGEQVEAVRLARQALGPDVPILQTVFSPLGVLENLTGRKALSGHAPVVRAANTLLPLLAENRAAVHKALKNIAATLASFTEGVLKAGADGLFFAELGLARTGYLTTEELDELARPYDLVVLEALKGAPAALHTCGPHGNPERFVSYPVQILQWADRAEGNPLLVDSAPWIGKKAVLGGVDETLFGTGAAPQIAAQAAEVVKALAKRPFLLSPGCAVPITVSDAELRALRSAAE